MEVFIGRAGALPTELTALWPGDCSGQQRPGIERDSVRPELEMQVRAGAPAGAARLPEQLAGEHDVAGGHTHRREMRVDRPDAGAHADEHDVAVALEPGRVAGRLDDARPGRTDVRGPERADVEPCVELAHRRVVAEAACHRSARGPV